jgi:hypothetical protein
MLSGGEALESYALKSASSVLAALAQQMPSVADRKRGSQILDVALEEIAVGDALVVYPHDICPVDGVVIEGHGVIDESYLTGEPFQITKTSGSTVISGAINAESALTIQPTKRAGDSRYAKIMEVMRESAASTTRRSIGRYLHPGGCGGRQDRNTYVWRGSGVHPFIPPFPGSIVKYLSKTSAFNCLYGEIHPFLAWRDGKPVGRIAAIVNRAHNERYEDKTGFLASSSARITASWRKRSLKRPPKFFDPEAWNRCAVLTIPA